MKKTIQFNAKCRQCIHYEILNLDGYFLDEDEFYCKLDNSLKTDEDECSNLKLDEKDFSGYIAEKIEEHIRECL